MKTLRWRSEGDSNRQVPVLNLRSARSRVPSVTPGVRAPKCAFRRLAEKALGQIKILRVSKINLISI